ncbi:glycosyltransferase, partial [Hazenella sp. IB182357]
GKAMHKLVAILCIFYLPNTPVDPLPHQPRISYKPVLGYFQSLKYPHIFVIDKVNGGKADSMNAALDYAYYDNVITLDADCILGEEALDIVNQVFEDENVIAAGGMVHILQSRSMDDMFFKLKHIVRFQIFEYMKGFYMYKSSLAKLDALAIISGAFGIFKRDVLIELKGFRQTIGEDIDITLQIQQYIMKHKDKKMIFIPEAVCYTESPEKWRDLFKQRVRWQKAFIDCVIKYRGFLLKSVFNRGVSFFFLIDSFLVGTTSTFFTTFSLLSYLFIPSLQSVHALLVYSISAMISSLIYSTIAVFVSRYHGTHFGGFNKIRLLTTMILDFVFYRYVTLFFVMYGTIEYIFKPQDWNKFERTGNNYEL